MLQPSNRLTLIDAMRPPPGFGFESAMGVTFTLDLRALLAAPAAFALTGADSVTDDGTQHEPIELLHAVRAHAHRITLFSQVGEIALPPSRRVFAFLERSVVAVRAPLGGVVHPKAWVLRYEALDDPDEQRLRVLVASRNLTFDASWDTLVRLDQSADASGVELGALGDLFEGLLAAPATIAPAPEHAKRVESLSAALRAVTFSAPPHVDDVRLHVLGLAPGASPLPADADRALIISPFLGTDFFADVWSGPVDTLVSRPEALDLLDAPTLDRAGSVYAFDDGSAADAAGTDERLSARDPGRPLVGLHAKVFGFEIDRRARLFLGSANATGAAFGHNVELLVELIGSREQLGVDRLCEGTADEPGLSALFLHYTPVTSGDEVGPTALDRARHAFARMTVTGRVEESGAGWAVTYRSAEPAPVVDGAAIYCWPLASPGNRRRVRPGSPLDERFETSLDRISGFLAVEIAHDDGTRTEFVVPVPLDGVPEQRDRALLRVLIGDAQRFLRYLLALLEEDPAQLEFFDALDGARPDGIEAGGGHASLPVLEKLLRTMRRDPAKLVALHPLVSDLAAEDALPPGFAEVWTMIYDVALDGGAA